MNDIGTILYGGLSFQGLLVLITIACWFWRRRPAVLIAQIYLLMIGGLVCLITAMPPVGQLFWRIGLSNAPHCLADSDCRSEWIFCAGWLAVSASALAIQIVVFVQGRSAQRTN
ncbi:MAG TPA: hypothetical protein VGQ35_04085 [Dongiaceae bacterium]|nr:hypothetical protein [Dongiaceae bacterium]